MKVFIGGLPWSLDNDGLREAFEEYGPVVDARVVFDKETQKSRGFGFVTMVEDADAEKLIAQGTMEITSEGRTRECRIDHANDKRESRGGGRPRAGGGGRPHDGGHHEDRGRRQGRRRDRDRDRY